MKTDFNIQSSLTAQGWPQLITALFKTVTEGIKMALSQKAKERTWTAIGALVVGFVTFIASNHFISTDTLIENAGLKIDAQLLTTNSKIDNVSTLLTSMDGNLKTMGDRVILLSAQVAPLGDKLDRNYGHLLAIHKDEIRQANIKYKFKLPGELKGRLIKLALNFSHTPSYNMVSMEVMKGIDYSDVLIVCKYNNHPQNSETYMAVVGAACAFVGDELGLETGTNHKQAQK